MYVFMYVKSSYYKGFVRIHTNIHTYIHAYLACSAKGPRENRGLKIKLLRKKGLCASLCVCMQSAPQPIKMQAKGLMHRNLGCSRTKKVCILVCLCVRAWQHPYIHTHIHYLHKNKPATRQHPYIHTLHAQAPKNPWGKGHPQRAPKSRKV